MSCKILVTIGIPILLVLGGCAMWKGSDPMLNFNEGEFRLTVYTEGHPSETLPLPVDSPLLGKIEEIFKNRKGEWKRSYISFAPVILVERDDCKINVQPSRIIVNYRASSGEWSQVIINIDGNQYSQVQKIASDLLNRDRDKCLQFGALSGLLD